MPVKFFAIPEMPPQPPVQPVHCAACVNVSSCREGEDAQLTDPNSFWLIKPQVKLVNSLPHLPHHMLKKTTTKLIRALYCRHIKSPPSCLIKAFISFYSLFTSSSLLSPLLIYFEFSVKIRITKLVRAPPIAPEGKQ